MLKVLSLSAVAAIAAMASQAAAATYTLDFVAEAASNERGVADGTTIDFGGLGVTFSAGSGGVGSDYAYFDDLSGGRPAGLGVCTVLSGTQCSPSNDDNLSSGETVTLKFDQLLDDLIGFRFFDDDHYLLSSSKSLSVVVKNTGSLAMATSNISFANLSSNSLKTNLGFAFAFDEVTFGYVDQNYYIGATTAIAAVPLPATAPMILGGLALMGAVGRRRKKTA